MECEMHQKMSNFVSEQRFVDSNEQHIFTTSCNRRGRRSCIASIQMDFYHDCFFVVSKCESISCLKLNILAIVRQEMRVIGKKLGLRYKNKNDPFKILKFAKPNKDAEIKTEAKYTT